MIRIVVLYDIQDDRIRTKVVNICADYGLDRCQYSVFTGRLFARHIRAMTKELSHCAKDQGFVLILPIASNEWDKRVEIGRALHV